MPFPSMLAITLNATQGLKHGEAFPVELAWLKDDGPIRSELVAPKKEWLSLPLAVEDHELTWEMLAKGRDLTEVLDLMDKDLAGQVVYSYYRDFHMMRNRKRQFEHRWFETPFGDYNPPRIPWGPAVSCIKASKWAHRTTKELPHWRGATRIIYALNYYSVLVQSSELRAFLDRWTQEEPNTPPPEWQ